MRIYKAVQPQHRPAHPGAILRDTALPALKLTVSQAARDLGVSRQFLHRLLNEQVPVSAKMALKIGRLCGNGPEVWANMQAAWDLWHARDRLGDDLNKVPERHRDAA